MKPRLFKGIHLAIYCVEVLICLWMLLSSVKLLIEYVDVLRLPNGWSRYLQYLQDRMPATMTTSADVALYVFTEIAWYILTIVFSIAVIASRRKRFLKAIMAFDILYMIAFAAFACIIQRYQRSEAWHFPFAVVVGCVIHFALSCWRRRALQRPEEEPKH